MLRALILLGAGAVGYLAYKQIKQPSNEALYGVSNEGYSPFTPPAPESSSRSETKESGDQPS